MISSLHKFLKVVTKVNIACLCCTQAGRRYGCGCEAPLHPTTNTVIPNPDAGEGLQVIFTTWGGGVRDICVAAKSLTTTMFCWHLTWEVLPSFHDLLTNIITLYDNLQRKSELFMTTMVRYRHGTMEWAPILIP